MALLLAFTTGEVFAAKATPKPPKAVTAVIQGFDGPTFSLARNEIWTSTVYDGSYYCDEEGCSGGNYTEYDDDWYANIATSATYKGKTISAASGIGFLSLSSDSGVLSVSASLSFDAFANDKLNLSFFRKGGSMPANDNLAVWAQTWEYNPKTEDYDQTIVKLVSNSVLDGDTSWTKVTAVLPVDGWYTLTAMLSNTNGSYGSVIAGLDDITLTSTKSGGGKGLEKFNAQSLAAPVPVPGSAWLLGPALVGLIARRRKTA